MALHICQNMLNCYILTYINNEHIYQLHYQFRFLHEPFCRYFHHLYSYIIKFYLSLLLEVVVTSFNRNGDVIPSITINFLSILEDYIWVIRNYLYIFDMICIRTLCPWFRIHILSSHFDGIGSLYPTNISQLLQIFISFEYVSHVLGFEWTLT